MTERVVARRRMVKGVVCAAGFLCASVAAVPAFGSGHGAPAKEAPAHGDEHAAGAVDYSGLKNRGIELGEYRVRTHYPVDAQKSTVQFALHVAVASEQYAEMQKLVDDHKHKLRDQVITATRLAPLIMFDEPGLRSFRRRIYLRLRRALPELAIDDVYVSEFQLTVKSL